MKKRLESFISSQGISQSQFAEAIGVAKASVSHVISGRNLPSFDFITSTATHFPTLNIDWLITGRGRMYSMPGDDDNLFQSVPQEGTIETPKPAQKKPDVVESPDSQAVSGERSIDRIVVFFKDGTYRELK